MAMRAFGWAVLFALGAASTAAADTSVSLEDGYRLMYGLKFGPAQREFLQWRQDHPRDPLGPVSQAANLLFGELDRLGVLQTQFFVDDSSFRSAKRLSPDPQLRDRFDVTLAEAETLARTRLSAEPLNHDALFALAMVYGLRADYVGLVEGRSMASLAYTRQGAQVARSLLAVAPDYADAYLATGISEYIVGSLFAPVRWVLRIAGYSGDKAQGMQELRLTAERGRFLGPFARILLAIAHLREHDRARARELLVGLNRDFPSNPLFAREIKRIDGKMD